MIKVIKQIFRKDNHYHLAVSMGADSVAAMFWMKWKEYSFTPIHFNHNLRTQNAIMHERFLELCNKLNLRGVSDTWIKGMGTESECREARLDFYERTAGKVLGGGTIVTAHHTDDWVEGYLLNCFRGHPNHDPIPMFSTFNNFKIIHPFLPTTKKDFQDFLVRNSWESWVVEDETNRIVRGSRRNWIRKQILPEMANQKLSLEKFAKRRIKKNIEELAKHG